jgi:glucokinase
MNENQPVALGLDLGGTACKLGVFDVKSGEMLEDTSSLVKDGKRPGADLFDQFCKAAEGLLRGRGMGPEQVVSVCVASAGILGPEGAREPAEFELVTNSPNIPGINGFNIKETLKARFVNAMTFIENDAKAHGWAEWFYGAGQEPQVHTVAGFTLGTGLGGFVVVDGKMIRPAELGHIPVDTSDDAPFCGCGMRGCAEAFVSKVAIRRLGSEFLARYPESKLKEIGESSHGFDPLPIAKAAEEGDEGCRMLYEQVGSYLGKLIWQLKRVFMPDVVICSGNIANDLHLMLPGIMAVLDNDRLLERLPVIRKTNLGPAKAGIIGAGALAIHGYRSRS